MVFGNPPPFTSVTTDSAEQTLSLGQKLGQWLKAFDQSVLTLNGPMGAGKTVLVQGICKIFKVKNQVASPTYSLVNRYSGIKEVFHLDFYRIENEADLIGLDLDEMLKSPGIFLIEWGNRFSKFLPKDHWILSISGIGDQQRAIKFSSAI